MPRRPGIIVLAGPNGAGKSTMAPLLLPSFAVREFVNADIIAVESSPSQPESAAFAAGREMIARLHDLAGRRRTFAFETTLASRHFAPWLARLTETGYSVHIAFLWLPSPEFARARVEGRVRQGGHDVPTNIVHRRYARGLHNFFTLYQPLSTTWRMYDNSVGEYPKLIAAGRGQAATVVTDQPMWDRIRGIYGDG